LALSGEDFTSDLAYGEQIKTARFAANGAMWLEQCVIVSIPERVDLFPPWFSSFLLNPEGGTEHLSNEMRRNQK
jgi:hypothetical protein